jgi:hypothetical protein
MTRFVGWALPTSISECVETVGNAHPTGEFFGK